MNHDFYEDSINLTDEQFRSQVIDFLEKQLPTLSGDIELAVTAAYDIAGLMATKHARALSADDPIDEILTIAGELEINPENAEELRKELVDKIKALS